MKNKVMKHVYHCHTKRCGHADGEDEEFVQSAIKAGVKTLCFTDHVAFPGYPQKNIRMDYEQVDEYISTINSLKEKYKEQIEIHVGFETEYYDGFDKTLREYKEKGIEILILGQHCFVRDGVIIYDSRKMGRTKTQIINDYVKYCTAAMETGLITVFAHPDILLTKVKSFDKQVKNACRKLIECAIKNDVYLEFNIHGIYNNHWSRFGYPNVKYWELVKEEYPKAKIVVGLDAHHCYEFTDNESYIEAKDAIKQLDLNIKERINPSEFK